MKHLLIILSILLLSSPVIGQETGVLFFSFENGEFVYSEEGDDDNDGSMLGNSRTENMMVKEHTLFLIEKSM